MRRDRSGTVEGTEQALAAARDGGRAVYAAKCYWPRVSSAEIERAARDAMREAALASRRGRRVDYVGSLLFPVDEIVLCLFESTSSVAVRCTNERAGIPCERVMPAIWLARLDTERSNR